MSLASPSPTPTSLGTPIGEKPKRSRAKLPKTKSGCLTCRKRRVKCDETRPTCQRCIKFGCVCDGYERFVSYNGPKAQNSSISLENQLVPATTMVKWGPRFQSQEEGRYFQFYCGSLASEISGPYKTSLWDRLVPQAAEMDPLIHNAVTALGALRQSQTASGCNLTHNDEPQIDAHHKYALVHYNKALYGLREAMKLGERDHRTALIACLLAFCFESLAGYQLAACFHAMGGTTLLQDLRSKARSKSPEIAAKNKAKCDLLAEEEICSALSSLDLQTLLALDSRPPELHLRWLEDINPIIMGMPSSFTDLQTCRQYLQLILRRNSHWTGAVGMTSGISRRTPSDGLGDEDENAGLRIGGHTWSVSALCRGMRNKVPLQLLNERNSYMDDTRRWHDASMKLFKGTSKPPTSEGDSRDFVATTLLKIHALMSVWIIGRGFVPSELEDDDYLPDFRLTIELCELIAPHLISKQNRHFRFDLGIVLILSLIGMRCRDRDIRQKVLDILSSLPDYREGIWDTGAIKTMVEVIRDLEEPWRDGYGLIPEDRWATIVELQITLNRRMVVLVVRQRIGTDYEGDFEDIPMELRW